MTPALLLRLTVDPTLAWLATMGIKSDDRARVMLLAIAGQESGLSARKQMGGGPARGLWQFEKGGGVAGVLRHAASRPAALGVCDALLVSPAADVVHPALEMNDHLACAFARLLLFTDPAALPGMDQPDIGWAYYLRTWRPGKPHPQTWAGHWREALEAVVE